MNATLPMGDGTQTPDEFVRAQSASTGLPERMCRANMKKNAFVLGEMRNILTSLTRGLVASTCSPPGHGEERGVPISYQAQSPVLGLVLPSNSPGVHTLWLPIIPMQIGLVLKPGPQEPWTPYRMAAAFLEAGIPREAISIYPGQADVGAAVLDSCARSLIFGGTPTVDRYRGNPRVQAHGPGFSKILLGDDQVDHWERYLDMMVESVFVNSGRELHQLLGHLGQPAHARDRRRAGARGWPRSGRCRRTTRRRPRRVHGARRGRGDFAVDRRRPQAPGVTDVTAKYRQGEPRSSSRGAPTTCCRPSCTASRPDAAGGEEGVHVSRS